MESGVQSCIAIVIVCAFAIFDAVGVGVAVWYLRRGEPIDIEAGLEEPAAESAPPVEGAIAG